jgi:signal transduction histidine kinase
MSVFVRRKRSYYSSSMTEAGDSGGWRMPKWLPARERAAIEEFGVQGRPIRFLIGVAATLGVLTIPVVARSTGIRLEDVLLVFAVNATWVLLADRLLYRRAATSVAAFYALAFGTVAQGAFISLSLPVLARTPSTPLWVAYILLACIVGASETEASLILGLFHSLAPLATVPVFLAQGHPLQRALAGPLIATFASTYGYWFSARRREHWRRDRHEREMALAAARLAESERERERLSRDLHDSVGTTLSLVALYGTIAEDQSDNAETRRLAQVIRDSARAALSELRGVLQALPQGPTTLEALAQGLALVAQRAAAPTGALLTVQVKNGSSAVVEGGLRTTIVRVFQEAVHNALHHGRAGQIRALLGEQDGRIELVVDDDGSGFDPSSPVAAGTGITGMRARARELGGEVTVESLAGQGARVRLELPVRPQSAP